MSSSVSATHQAAYLVNMTFINEALAQRGEAWRVSVNFGVMKFVFLAIVVYEAWIIPRPVKLTLPS